MPPSSSIVIRLIPLTKSCIAGCKTTLEPLIHYRPRLDTAAVWADMWHMMLLLELLIGRPEDQIHDPTPKVRLTADTSKYGVGVGVAL